MRKRRASSRLPVAYWIVSSGCPRSGCSPRNFMSKRADGNSGPAVKLPLEARTKPSPSEKTSPRSWTRSSRLGSMKIADSEIASQVLPLPSPSDGVLGVVLVLVLVLELVEVDVDVELVVAAVLEPPELGGFPL